MWIRGGTYEGWSLSVLIPKCMAVFTSPLRPEGCEVLRSAYLYVCLSAHISQNHVSELHEIVCTCYLWPWLGPHLTTLQCVMYFRFCGWRHVSHNRAYVVYCTARITAEGCQSEGGNAERGGLQRFSSAYLCLCVTSLGRKPRRIQRNLAMEMKNALCMRGWSLLSSIALLTCWNMLTI